MKDGPADPGKGLSEPASYITEAKSRLRGVVAERVAAIPAEQRVALDREICRRLCASELYRQAEQVVAYLALNDEVSLSVLTGEARRSGRLLFLPVVVGAGEEMVFRLYESDAELVRSPLGVLEPRCGDSPQRRPSLVLVPGRAFDSRGSRLGRGGGHYDKAMAALRSFGPTVGVAYQVQIVDRVPCLDFDERVDAVACENGVYWVA